MNREVTPTISGPREFEIPPTFLVEGMPGSSFAASGAFVVTDDGGKLDAPRGIIESRRGEMSDSITKAMLMRARADLNRFPKNSKSLLNLGMALMSAGQLEEAKSAFTSVIEQEPGNYAALDNLVKILTQQENLDDAGYLCEVALDTFPGDPTFAIGKSTVLVHRKDFAGALATLNEAHQRHQKDPSLQYAIGVLYIALGDYRSALSFLKRVSKRLDHSPQVFQALGAAYALFGQIQEATKAFKTAIALDSTSTGSVRGLAQILSKSERFEEVARLLAGYVVDQEDDQAKELLAHALFKIGKPSSSRALLQTLLAAAAHEDNKYKMSQFENDIGCCFAHEGNIAAAERFFLRAIHTSETRGYLPFLNLASQMTKANRASEARPLLERAIRLFPEASSLYGALSFIEEREGFPLAAIRLLERGTHCPDATWQVFATLGFLLSEATHEYERARKVLEAGLSKFPRELVVINNLAYVCLLAGSHEQAERLISKAQNGASDVFLTATKGLLALKRNDFEASRSLYRRAAKLAVEKGDSALGRAVRQKMHLEFAKSYLVAGSADEAMREVQAGMTILNGRNYYERDLAAMAKVLTSGDDSITAIASAGIPWDGPLREDIKSG